MKIGSHYDVPQVRAIWRATVPRWLPVLGPLHMDEELNFAHWHWHIDQRFLPTPIYRQCLSETNPPSPHYLYNFPIMVGLVVPLGRRTVNDETGYIVGVNPKWHSAEYERTVSDYLRSLPRETWLRVSRMTYKRPFERCEAHASLRSKLAVTHRGATLNLRRTVCPHRGADLSGIEPVDGVITCPLHGMQFCARTGKAIHPTTGRRA